MIHDTRLDLYLEEENLPPTDSDGDKMYSKGFFDPITLQDFPIRGLQVFMHIKRRRWLNLVTGKQVHRNWEMVAKGTRITQDFADFLKAISG